MAGTVAACNSLQCCCVRVIALIANRPSLQAYLEGDEEVIKAHCSPEMVERLTGIMRAQRQQGLVPDPTLLDTSDVSAACLHSWAARGEETGRSSSGRSLVARVHCLPPRLGLQLAPAPAYFICQPVLS